MMGGFSFFQCFGNGSFDDDPPQLDPVLLISGIGGSILHSKGKKLGLETRVWVRILLADLEFKKKVWSIYNPQTGYTESLDKDTQLLVPEDDYGLYAIDILDPSPVIKCLHVTDVYYFHNMIEMLIKFGYKKGTTLFGYGYDFRQSNRIDKLMEGLKVKLETAYKASGGRKVNIISHSMGGLLVSCFLSLHNDLIECPSIYEMLANPDFNWKRQPLIQVWRKQSKDDETSVELESFDPVESINLFEDALRKNELDFDGKKIALPFNYAILKWASNTRQVLNNAKLPDGVSFYSIYGTSFETPFDVCYGSKTSPIEDLSEICHTLPEYSFVNGDGTVPAESAMADGFEAVERVGIPATHRQVLQDESVFKLIQKWLELDQKVVNKHSKTSRVADASSSNI